MRDNNTDHADDAGGYNSEAKRNGMHEEVSVG
jgi:hypothetical protein